MKKYGCVVFCLILGLSGCHWFRSDERRPKPDVSSVKIDYRSHRFDKDIFNLPNSDFPGWKKGMLEKYGEFYFFYLDNFVIGPRPQGDTAEVDEPALHSFIADRYIRTIQDSIDSQFKDTKHVDEELSRAFIYFKHYIPAFNPPDVIYFNSSYSAGAASFGKQQVVVGLDMFLGPENRDYDSVGVFMYLRHKMKPAYIPRYVLESVYDANFENGLNSEQNLLDAIVDRGRKLYFLSYLFPEAPDSLILGYTEKQTAFCRDSEKEIWKFLNDKDVLLKNNSMDKTRYLGEGPTTSGMPEDAPGNIGNYIGLKIVRKFMAQNNGSVSLQDLVAKYSANDIFKKSAYRP